VYFKFDLTEVKDPVPLFPVVGQTMPTTYVEVHRLADILRAVGGTISHDEELFILVDGKDEIKSPEDSYNTGMQYCNINVIEDVYQKYSAWKTTNVGADDSGTTDHITVVGDALTLYDAQGYIYIHKPLIYLNPKLIGDLMGAITDHRLTEDFVIKSEEFKREIVQYVKKNDCEDDDNPIKTLKDALRNFIKTGRLSYSHVVPFLFRKTGLAPEHHVYVIDMFKDAGIICLSSLKFEGEDKDETGMDKFIARRPIVIYRLSSQRPPIAKYWPKNARKVKNNKWKCTSNLCLSA